MEYLQTKLNFIEKSITGHSLVMIENGNISNVKTATLEPNG
jgi:uncharacterized membrane protein YcaP (DUF421 family)